MVSQREAIAVAVALAIGAAVLLPFLNAAAVQLAFIAVAIAATYPLAKRFIPIPQLYLGVAFSFGIPMAFAAVLGTVPVIGWLLMLANAFWVLAYDTEYAMVDRDDDLRLGIKSSAIFFGRFDVAAVMASYGAFCVVAGCNRPHDWRWMAVLCRMCHRCGVSRIPLRADSHPFSRWLSAGVSA